MKLQQRAEGMRLAGEKFEILQSAKTKKPGPAWRGRASWYGVAVTYFRVRMHTIIGANPFHGPVRDGKAWFQIAIAATWTVRGNTSIAANKSGRNKVDRDVVHVSDRVRDRAKREDLEPARSCKQRCARL